MDKGREQKYVELAAKRLGWLVRHIEPRESPDFQLVLADGSVCGLEVVEIVDERAAEGWIAARRLRDALRELLNATSPPLFVHLSFDTGRSYLVARPRTRRQHASALSELIVRRPLPKERLIFERARLSTAGAPHVHRMLVAPSKALAVSYGGHGSVYPDADLARAMMLKDELVPRYRGNLPQAAHFWLLVVGNARAGGTFVAEVAQRGSRATAFDRVFYVDALDDEAFEIATASGAD